MAAPFSQDYPAHATAPYQFQPLGCAQLAITTTAQNLGQLLTTAAAASPVTAKFTSVPTGAKVMAIVVETASVRWTDDGTAPTSSYGMLMTTTLMPMTGGASIYSGDLATIQFIAVSGSPVIDVAFYK
jgi:hypothetical protein